MRDGFSVVNHTAQTNSNTIRMAGFPVDSDTTLAGLSRDGEYESIGCHVGQSVPDAMRGLCNRDAAGPTCEARASPAKRSLWPRCPIYATDCTGRNLLTSF